MNRQGFSLIEILVAVAILGLIAGIAGVYTSGRTDTATVRDQAIQMAQEFRASLAQAINSGDNAVFLAGSSSEGGWYAVWRQDYELEDYTPPGTRTFDIHHRLAWGTGGTVAGPMGIGSAAAHPGGPIVCDAWSRCNTGPEPVGFYLHVPGDPQARAAVTIGPSGGIRAWIWNAQDGEWR